MKDESWCRLVRLGLFWEQAEEMLFRGSQQKNQAFFVLSALKLFWLLLLRAGLGLLV